MAKMGGIGARQQSTGLGGGGMQSMGGQGTPPEEKEGPRMPMYATIQKGRLIAIGATSPIIPRPNTPAPCEREENEKKCEMKCGAPDAGRPAAGGQPLADVRASECASVQIPRRRNKITHMITKREASERAPLPSLSCPALPLLGTYLIR